MSNFFNKCKEILNRLSSVDVKDTSDDYTQYAGEVDIRELKLAKIAVGQIIDNLDPTTLSKKTAVKVPRNTTRHITGNQINNDKNKSRILENEQSQEHTR